MVTNNGQNAQVQKVPQKGKKLWIKLLTLALVPTLVFGGYFGYKNRESIKNTVVTKFQSKEMRSTNFNNFIINLSDSNFRRYLKINLVLEFKDKKTEQEINKNSYKIRDTIINLIASKSADDFRTIQGKEKLKDELIEAINTNLDKGEIENLFWTEFVIQ